MSVPAGNGTPIPLRSASRLVAVLMRMLQLRVSKKIYKSMSIVTCMRTYRTALHFDAYLNTRGHAVAQSVVALRC